MLLLITVILASRRCAESIACPPTEWWQRLDMPNKLNHTHDDAAARIKSPWRRSEVTMLQKVFAKGSSGFGSDVTEENIDRANMQCLAIRTLLILDTLRYGEVTYQGMEKLYDALDLKKDDVFYDLGCGVGKLVLYVALRGGPQRSVGLEAPIFLE